MKTAEIESDLNVLHRLTRAWLNDAIRLVIDARGLTITVPTEAAARRFTALALTWAGTVGAVPVTVTVETPAPAPAPRPRVVA